MNGTATATAGADLTASCSGTSQLRALSAFYSVNAGSFYQSYRVTALVPSQRSYRMFVSPTSSTAPNADVSLTVVCALLAGV